MNPPQPTSVQIERNFDVPPAMVWRGWTDAALVRRWFGSDPTGTVLDAQLDVRPGGRFEVTFADLDGTTHTCGGEYAEVQANSKLSFSWNWRNEPGVETFVSVQLLPQGTGTHMHFEHARLFAASAHDYAAGWRRTFEKLTRALTEASSDPRGPG